MTDLLLSQRPAPSPRILEIGTDVGSNFPLLDEKNRRVQRIPLDVMDAAVVGAGEQIAACQRFAEFEGEPGGFDVVLLRESAQCIEPLVIFNKVLDWLSPAGIMLIVGEPSWRPVGTDAEGVHWLGDMAALAGRFGFELVECLDLSSRPAPTLDYLLEAATVHKQEIIGEPSSQPEAFEVVGETKRACRGKYAFGHHSLLHFIKKSVPRWRLRLVEEQHADEMLALFERVFGHRMEPEMQRWKYGEGRGCEIGVWRDGRMVGHYGGMRRDILFFGQRQMAAQIGDVMVDSNERGVLTRSGPFFLMAATFLERYLGFGKPFLLGFGFPEHRAMRLAELQGLYATVGRMVELAWLTTTRMRIWLTRSQTVEKRDLWAAAAVDGLWEQMAEDLQGAVVGVRDWHYLVHRYFGHPHHRYRVILVGNRFGRRFYAALVLRREQGGCELVDIVAPLRNIPLAIDHARRLAGMEGDTRLFCRITENFAPQFEVAGSIRQELDIHIPANVWSSGPAPDILQGHWWLMSGDTDYR